MNYVATIGLETHVQLRTHTKIWCGCPNDYGQPPNTLVCPVCLGYPGAMPVLNEEAVRLTVITGLMLGCTINQHSKWDRKNYYYPDMPKNYQISQYDEPLCLGGGVEIDVDGVKRTVQLTRIHLEEDVGKSMHFAQSSGVDYNRAGTPLMEIVTEPDLHTADETFAYLQALKQILSYGGVSDCNLEEGNIRCDVNCSVRPEGQEGLGTKTEIKNMNTFKGVHRALSYEIQRQIKELESGGRIIQETRRWDDELGVTQSMRTKEEAHDYRYFPEPDLVPVVISDEELTAYRKALPELPEARKARMMAAYGIPEYDAGVLAAEKAVADYFEEAALASSNPKAVSNWVMTEMMRAMGEAEQTIMDVRITPSELASLVDLVEKNVVNSNSAKDVFQIMYSQGGDPVLIVEAKGLAQVSDSSELEKMVDDAIAANPKSVEDYKAGKKAAIQFLMGQVMRLSKGKANPKLVTELLKSRLNA